MQRSEFDQLVKQFPVVRSKQHRREWYTRAESGSAGSSGADAAAASSLSAVAPAASSSSSLAPTVSSIASPAQSSSVQPAVAPASGSSTSSSTSSSCSLSTGLSSSGSDFYAQLGAHLRASGYSDAVASATVSHFRDAHRQTLAGLALDEMDIVARSIGAARAQAHKQQLSPQLPQAQQQAGQPPQAASSLPAPAAGIDLMVD